MLRPTKIKLALAPMAGITDKAFRQICQKWEADITWSEMVSSEGLVRQKIADNKSLKLAEKFNDTEKNYWVQIFGSNPNSMAQASKIIEQQIKPVGIDINLGCPVKKAQKAGYGAIQIKNIPEVIKIIKTIKQELSLPLSLKTRVGLKNSKEILKFAPQLEKAGLDQLVIHARTLKGMFKEEPDWKIVKKLNNILKIPIIYNGGIKTVENAKFYANRTGCKILMIGQAVIGNPWFFKEIQYYLKNNKNIKISATEKKNTILEHAKLSIKYNSKQGILNFRTHLVAYLKGTANASKLKRKAVQIKNIEDIEKILEQK